MHVCWNIYRFDYARYLLLRPRLRTATTPDALARLDDSEALTALADDLEEGVISLEVARNAVLQWLCCEGESLAFDAHLPTFLANLTRRKGMEDAGETLSGLLTNAPHIEPGWQCESGLRGFLTPDETAKVFHTLMAAGASRRRRGRRGGLVRSIVAFVRSLFASGPQDDESLALLLALLREAVREEQGVALVAG